MTASFAVIGSIASTTRKFINNVRAQTQRHLIFEPKKVPKNLRKHALKQQEL